MQQAVENMPTRLNNQQLDMLRLLDKPLPESDYLFLKQQVVKLLSKQLDDEMDALEKEHNWTAETYQQWGNEHNRVSK